MNATERVARTQSQLRFVVLSAGILWGVTAMIAILAVEVLVGRWTRGATVAGRGWDWNIALGAGVLACAWVFWRARFVVSARRVALWIEERAPSLQYALVTASDPDVSGDTSMLDAAISRSNMDALVRPAVMTPAIHALVALSVTAGLFAIAITAVSARAPESAAGAAPSGTPAAAAGNRLVGLSAVITPPTYARGVATAVDDPSALTALIGSVVTLRGRGPAAGVGAEVGSRAVRVSGRRSSWDATFIMPSSATTVTLTDRDYDRVIALIPVVDQPPSAVMLEPTRDTVWRRVPAGSRRFVVRATDDVGLARGRLEYTVTTGSGEIFTSKTATWVSMDFAGARTGTFSGTLPLAPLRLTEGAILSIRAVVTDNNTLTGPGEAASDTRTFRVARADEYDSLAVDAAPPPPVEKSLLTERMLIISAESLLKSRRALTPPAFTTSSGRIGSDQADLRKKVYGILYEQEEAGGKGGTEGDDEELDPQLVLNRDLKIAYDAMWDAERSLNMGEIRTALPFMARASAALDRARLADRLYLRGRPPRIIVNVEKVRLTGHEKGLGNAISTPRSQADSTRARFDAELGGALIIAQSDPKRFIDVLIRLRADAATAHPIFAAQIGEAVDAFRAGKDMTDALVRARRALVGAPRTGNPSIPWTGAWSGAR